jgi:thiol-disulfide isomerase/thioredoxin
MRHILALALIIGSATTMAGDRLKVGDSAPGVFPETFLKGEPIKSFAPDEVYLIDFWGTWCGPCLEAFPHLGELQSTYKHRRLKVVAVHVAFKSDTAAGFFAKNRDKMDFTVAVDGRGGAFEKAWKTEGNDDGIPRCVVVAGGKVVHAGDPRRLTKEKLGLLIAAAEAERERGDIDIRKAFKAPPSKQPEGK